MILNFDVGRQSNSVTVQIQACIKWIRRSNAVILSISLVMWNIHKTFHLFWLVFFPSGDIGKGALSNFAIFFQERTDHQQFMFAVRGHIPRTECKEVVRNIMSSFAGGTWRSLTRVCHWRPTPGEEKHEADHRSERSSSTNYACSTAPVARGHRCTDQFARRGMFYSGWCFRTVAFKSDDFSILDFRFSIN